MFKGFKTEGVILKRRDFGEADRLLTVFSLQNGKITVLAKGVRRITSRRGGNVELLNRVVMFLHPGKNFLILTEAQAVETYQKIKEDLTLSTYGYHIIELIDRLSAENQHDPFIYENLVEILNKLNATPRQIYIRAFEAKLLYHLGFVDFEEVESANLQNVSPGIPEILDCLVRSSWNTIEEMKITRVEAMELESILRYHIEKVIEGFLKSRKFLQSGR